MGIAPAGLIAYVRGHVEESSVFLASRKALRRSDWHDALEIFRPPLLKLTMLVSLLNCGFLSAYYAVTTWLPAYLQTERHLSVSGTSGYLLVLIAGSFAGYLTSAALSDSLGRRRCTCGDRRRQRPWLAWRRHARWHRWHRWRLRRRGGVCVGIAGDARTCPGGPRGVNPTFRGLSIAQLSVA